MLCSFSEQGEEEQKPIKTEFLFIKMEFLGFLSYGAGTVSF